LFKENCLKNGVKLSTEPTQTQPLSTIIPATLPPHSAKKKYNSIIKISSILKNVEDKLQSNSAINEF
jgi:hypothetical protein